MIPLVAPSSLGSLHGTGEPGEGVPSPGFPPCEEPRGSRGLAFGAGTLRAQRKPIAAHAASAALKTTRETTATTSACDVPSTGESARTMAPSRTPMPAGITTVRMPVAHARAYAPAAIG